LRQRNIDADRCRNSFPERAATTQQSYAGILIPAEKYLREGASYALIETK
jgi:hypothetical protein